MSATNVDVTRNPSVYMGRTNAANPREVLLSEVMGWCGLVQHARIARYT